MPASTATNAASYTTPRDTIGKLLGHTQARTTERYAHLDADPLRKASNAIGATIAAALGDDPKTGDVIPMRKGGGRNSSQG